LPPEVDELPFAFEFVLDHVEYLFPSVFASIEHENFFVTDSQIISREIGFPSGSSPGRSPQVTSSFENEVDYHSIFKRLRECVFSDPESVALSPELQAGVMAKKHRVGGDHTVRRIGNFSRTARDEAQRKVLRRILLRE
jgi:hypothetical protein